MANLRPSKFESQQSHRVPPNTEASGSHELVVIYSSSSISEIVDFLNSYDDEKKDASAMIRIDYTRSPRDSSTPEYTETNRTIALVKKTVFKSLLDRGYGEKTEYDFRISKYEIRDGNLPPDGCVYALFVVVPREIDHKSAEDQLHAKLRSVVDTGLLPKGGYMVSFPAITRENDGKYRGYAIVSFAPQIPKSDCARVKVLLDMTRWYDESHQPYFCHIAWCRAVAFNRLGMRASHSSE